MHHTFPIENVGKGLTSNERTETLIIIYFKVDERWHFVEINRIILKSRSSGSVYLMFPLACMMIEIYRDIPLIIDI